MNGYRRIVVALVATTGSMVLSGCTRMGATNPPAMGPLGNEGQWSIADQMALEKQRFLFWQAMLEQQVSANLVPGLPAAPGQQAMNAPAMDAAPASATRPVTSTAPATQTIARAPATPTTARTPSATTPAARTPSSTTPAATRTSSTTPSARQRATAARNNQAPAPTAQQTASARNAGNRTPAAQNAPPARPAPVQRAGTSQPVARTPRLSIGFLPVPLPPFALPIPIIRM